MLFITACGNNTARGSVDRYLKKYKTLDSEVLVDLEKVIESENLTKDQAEKYRNVLKKQYKDLTYDILEEEYDDEVSYVTVKISVYDLYRANYNAALYLENNRSEFYDENGNYDVNKYIDYRLDKMKDMIDRIDYTIIFTVTKDNNKYEVVQPTDNDLKKIHGIYNYELS